MATDAEGWPTVPGPSPAHSSCPATAPPASGCPPAPPFPASGCPPPPMLVPASGCAPPPPELTVPASVGAMGAERESHRTVATAARNAAQKETVLHMRATALSETGIWKRQLAFSSSEQALAVRR